MVTSLTKYLIPKAAVIYSRCGTTIKGKKIGLKNGVKAILDFSTTYHRKEYEYRFATLYIHTPKRLSVPKIFLLLQLAMDFWIWF